MDILSEVAETYVTNEITVNSPLHCKPVIHVLSVSVVPSVTFCTSKLLAIDTMVHGRLL
jgi:hypothetical protein